MEIYKVEYQLGTWQFFRNEKQPFDEIETPQDLESIVEDIASFLRDNDEEMPIDYLKVRINGKEEYRFKINEEKVSIFSCSVII